MIGARSTGLRRSAGRHYRSGDTEVSDLSISRGSEQYIPGFDVPVNHPLGMGVADLLSEAQARIEPLSIQAPPSAPAMEAIGFTPGFRPEMAARAPSYGAA